MKRLFLTAAFFLLAFETFASSYRISKVEYDIDGMTKVYALEQNIPVDKKRIFSTKEELDSYVEDLKQSYLNQRNFESAEIEYEIYTLLDFSEDSVTEANVENEITEITLRVALKDSRHLLVLPYPKYSSSSGFTLKLKAKDTNFLGTLSEFNADTFFAFVNEDDSDKMNFQFGFNIDYDFPFKIGTVDAKWINEYDFSYMINDSCPEFSAQTGLEFDFPVKDFSINLQLLQMAGNDLDYLSYGDALYFGNKVNLSVPLNLYQSKSYTDFYLIPYLDFTAYYDTDGISKENLSLSSPLLQMGTEFKADNINWHGNFRDGYYFDLKPSYGYNLQLQTSVPRFSFDIEAFKSFKRLALSGRIYGFIQSEKNSYEKVGSYIRGVRDESHFAKGSAFEDSIALNVQSAIIFNFDLPIRLFTWDWTKFSKSSFLENLNFEVQINPFIDIALTTNLETARYFYPGDGYYAGGFEVLVFPQKWRGIVVRGSMGFDLGNLLLSKMEFYDTSWRRDVSAYEIYIGIGLHY